MKEQGFQRKIIKYLEDKGAYVVKVSVASKKGVPDILACYKSYFIGIEVKRPEKRNETSPLQVHNLKRIKEARGYSTVAVYVEDIKPILDEIDGLQIH